MREHGERGKEGKVVRVHTMKTCRGVEWGWAVNCTPQPGTKYVGGRVSPRISLEERRDLFACRNSNPGRTQWHLISGTTSPCWCEVTEDNYWRPQSAVSWDMKSEPSQHEAEMLMKLPLCIGSAFCKNCRYSLLKVCGVAVQEVCWAQRCAVCLKGSPLMERNSIEGTCDAI